MLRPDGHRDATPQPGAVAGVSTAPAHAMGRGKRVFPQTPVTFDLGETPFSPADHSHEFVPRQSSSQSRMPKSDFPKFDGDNPSWWKTVAEKYFHMYSVPRESWASFATLHFRGNAALWLQTFEAMHEVESWEELVVAVHAKFGRDKYHRHLEALERIRQTDTVDAYHHKFEELMHKVLVHNKHYDEAFFVTKFVKGLRHDIQSAIRLHKPRTVDSALALAQTQEDLLEEARHLSSGRFKSDYKSTLRPHFSSRGILGSGQSA